MHNITQNRTNDDNNANYFRTDHNLYDLDRLFER